jgi:hypothetical protein
MSRRLTAIALVPLCAALAAGASGCRRGPAAADETGAPLLVHLDVPLGPDLQLAGLSIAARPDRTSWIVTLHSTVLRSRDPRPRLWVHAYPQESQEYFTMSPSGGFAPAVAGRSVADGFLLERAGAYNLYAGVTGADGSLGPAVGLGWIGVGDPETPEYHRAYRFLQEADDSRADAMLAQTRHDYPDATLP